MVEFRTTQSPDEEIRLDLNEKGTEEDYPTPSGEVPNTPSVDRSQMSNEWKRDNPE